MTCTTWRNALTATGAVLAAASLTLAGCSRGDQSSDYSDANPGAVTRATDTAEAGMSGPSAAASGVASDTSSSVVSTARTVPSDSGGVGTSPALSKDGGATAPPPSISNPGANPDSGATTGRATGPRS